jgi:hypothetical protein
VLRAFRVLPEIEPAGWPWSMRKIADWCGVSQSLVAQLSTVLTCPWLAGPVTGVDGKTYAPCAPSAPVNDQAPAPSPAGGNGQAPAAAT